MMHLMIMIFWIICVNLVQLCCAIGLLQNKTKNMCNAYADGIALGIGLPT